MRYCIFGSASGIFTTSLEELRIENMKRRFAVKGLKIALFGVVVAGVLGLVVMGLWNWLAPEIFGARTITFWQALGLLILSRILAGGFRGGPGRGMHWRARMINKWEQMSPEEREKFRHGMRGRCGFSRSEQPAGTSERAI
jgi:hypothetical protein